MEGVALSRGLRKNSLRRPFIKTKTIFVSCLGPPSRQDPRAELGGAYLVSLRTHRQASVAGTEQLLGRKLKEV